LKTFLLYSDKTPIILEQDLSLPIIIMQLVIKDKGTIGDTLASTTYIYAKMLEEGTKTLGKAKITKELEENAISIKFIPTQEAFTIQIIAFKNKFKKGIKILKNILQDPNFTSKIFKKQKTKTFSTILTKEADFDYQSYYGLLGTIYNSCAAKPIIGTIQDLESLSLKDLEQKHNSILVKQSAIFAFGGDIDEKMCQKFAQEILDLMKNTPHKKPKALKPKTIQTPKVLKKNTTQSYISFGTFFQDEQEHLCNVASFVLAGGFGSRIMEEIRVKNGLAYSVWAKINQGKYIKNFVGGLQTSLETEKKAIELLQETITKFVKNGITKEELQSAKNYYLGSEPIKEETMIKRLRRILRFVYLEKDLNENKKNLERVKKIGLEEINAFVKKHDEINSLNFFIVNA